jgi:hypothetical protein
MQNVVAEDFFYYRQKNKKIGYNSFFLIVIANYNNLYLAITIFFYTFAAKYKRIKLDVYDW